MGMITEDFITTLERDDDELEIFVSAEGEIDYADRDVGIMNDGIGYVNLTSVTTEDGKVVTLTPAEDAKVSREAEEQLGRKLRRGNDW